MSSSKYLNTTNAKKCINFFSFCFFSFLCFSNEGQSRREKKTITNLTRNMYQELCAETHPYIIFSQKTDSRRTTTMQTHTHTRPKKRKDKSPFKLEQREIREWTNERTRECNEWSNTQKKEKNHRTECLMRQNTQTDAYTIEWTACASLVAYAFSEEKDMNESAEKKRKKNIICLRWKSII